MFYINPDGHFVLRRLQLLPRNFTLPLNLPPEDTHSNHLPSLPLPNPFKTTKARSVEQVTLDENKEELGRIGVSDEEDAGQLRSDCLLVGLRTLDVDGKLRGICWSERDMTVSIFAFCNIIFVLKFGQAFEYARGSLRMLFFSPVVGIQDLKWIDEYSYAAEFAVGTIIRGSWTGLIDVFTGQVRVLSFTACRREQRTFERRNRSKLNDEHSVRRY